jgi:zinc transport system substrate-binding protein
VRRWWVLAGIVALVATGCSAGDTFAAGKTGVVAAFYPVAAAAQQIGGSCVDVKNLTPAGAEPHDLELIPDQVDKIQDADVVFVMGHGFQPAVEKAADQRDGPTVKLLDRLGIDAQGRRVADEGHGGDAVPVRALDPHVWLDPVLYAKLVEAVKTELVKADPKCRATFERNAARYEASIDQVGLEYATGLRDCTRRTIVTAHEAFGYLAKQYHLTQDGIAGIAPDEEPNAQRIAQLSDLVHDKGITTIFTEELVSPKVADALAREAGGVKTATLNPLEGLTNDEVAHGADWASVMRQNLKKLRTALGCT